MPRLNSMSPKALNKALTNKRMNVFCREVMLGNILSAHRPDRR